MKNIILVLVPFLILISCNTNGMETEEVAAEPVVTEPVEEEIFEIELMKDGIKLSSVNYETAYPEAKLSLNNFSENELKVGTNDFAFEVENYNLTENTEDQISQMCANSGKGQHIHFIMDNQPYSAEYASVVQSDVAEGHHVLLAFLARSYHMSIKNGDAHLIQEFNAGEGEYEDNFNESEAHLFYSRPKGSYTGLDAERVLLDFFLINTDLKSDGNYVRAFINGVEFILPQWTPYVVEGLPMGTNEITLELLNKDGDLVKSPFNPVTRTFELLAE